MAKLTGADLLSRRRVGSNMAKLTGADLLAVKEYFASTTICGGAPLRLHTETVGKLSAHCETAGIGLDDMRTCLLYTSPSPRDS